MAISVSSLVAAPTTLSTGTNNVTVTYSGLVTLASDNNVAISAVSGNANVRVVSVMPSSAAFPMLASGALLLSLQLAVSSSGGGVLQATVTTTFRTATGAAITRSLVFLY